MDAVKTWFSDKKNLPIIIAAAVVIVLILAFVLFRVMGQSSGTSTGTISSTSTTTMASSSSSTAPTSGGRMVPGIGWVSDAAPSKPSGDSSTTANSSAPKDTSTEPLFPYRKDPFVPLQGSPTRTKVLETFLPQVQHYQFPRPVQPVRLPSIAKVVESTPEVLPPQPMRRMAGILVNGRVSAILETNGESDIVYPGMELTRGNSHVRVDSISSDEIVLRTLDTRKPFTIRVGLSGAISLPSSGNAEAASADVSNLGSIQPVN